MRIRAAGGTVWRIALGLVLAGGCKRVVSNAPNQVASTQVASTQVASTQVAADGVSLRRQFQQKLVGIAPHVVSPLPYVEPLRYPEGEARNCPLLVEYLLHSTRFDRLTAANTLKRLGPYARPAAPALVLALKHPENEIRILAADILAYTHADPKVVLPGLLEATHDPSIWMSTLTAIYHTGPADADDVDQLVKVNPSSTTGAKWTAVIDPDAGRKILEAAKAIDISRPPDVAMSAEEAEEIRMTMQPAPSPVEPPRASISREYYESTRKEWDEGLDRRMTALYRMSTLSSAAVPGLTAVIDERLFWEHHIRAFERLRDLGPVAAYAAPELAKSLIGSPYVADRRVAYEALERMGSEASLAVPILIAGITEESYGRILALLCRIEPQQRHQDEPLIAQLSSLDYVTRVQAARSLNGAAPPEVLDALVRVTARRDLLAREGLVMAIDKAHPHPEEVLQTLRELALSEDGNVRARGMAALQEIDRKV